MTQATLIAGLAQVGTARLEAAREAAIDLKLDPEQRYQSVTACTVEVLERLFDAAVGVMLAAPVTRSSSKPIRASDVLERAIAATGATR